MIVTYDQAVAAKRKAAVDLFSRFTNGTVTSVGVSQDQGEWVVIIGLAPGVLLPTLPEQVDGVRLLTVRQGHAVAAGGRAT